MKILPKKRNLFIFGASGHAKVVASVAQQIASYEEIIFVDRTPLPSQSFFGLKVVSEETLNPGPSDEFFVGIGDNLLRKSIVEKLAKRFPHVGFAKLIDTRAIVSDSVSCAEGVVIMAGAIVQAGATLSKHSFVNTGAIVDHDCRIDEFASIGPGAVLGGAVHIGAEAAVGIGATIIQCIEVGSKTWIGAHSLVNKNIPSGVVAYGLPAKVVRTQVYTL